MLTEAQVDLIRQSAEKLAESNVTATNAFYANLFAEAPDVRALFPSDLFQQSARLWNAIVLVVESVDHVGGIVDELRDLGARHVDYGAKPEHYGVVIDVLIATISKLMDKEWSEDHHIAWRAALDAVCDAMLEGAARRAA